jgi:hypothetical protein
MPVCCYLLVVVPLCTGFVHHANTAGTAAGVSDRQHTQTHRMHTCTSMLCISNWSLQLSAGCSEYCRMHSLHRVCATWQHPGTGCKACLTASTHANRHAHHLLYCVLLLTLCSCGCLQSILVTAVCTGFVQHADTARYSLQHLFDRSNTSQ